MLTGAFECGKRRNNCAALRMGKRCSCHFHAGNRGETNADETLAEETKTQGQANAETPQNAQGDKQAEDNKNAAEEEPKRR